MVSLGNYWLRWSELDELTVPGNISDVEFELLRYKKQIVGGYSIRDED